MVGGTITILTFIISQYHHPKTWPFIPIPSVKLVGSQQAQGGWLFQIELCYVPRILTQSYAMGIIHPSQCMDHHCSLVDSSGTMAICGPFPNFSTTRMLPKPPP